jgi:predicted TIM-barrel enzyme
MLVVNYVSNNWCGAEVRRAAPHTPVVVGSGVTVDNAQRYLDASAIIVGSHFKQNGR